MKSDKNVESFINFLRNNHKDITNLSQHQIDQLKIMAKDPVVAQLIKDFGLRLPKSK